MKTKQAFHWPELTSASVLCVTVRWICIVAAIKQVNELALCVINSSMNVWCVTIKQLNKISAICYNQTSKWVSTVWQSNSWIKSVRSATIRRVSESVLCDNQTHQRPRAYSKPAIRYRLHFHVNIEQLKTYAIKKSRSLTLSLKQILLSGSHKS
jgi:hypothetical protein